MLTLGANGRVLVTSSGLPYWAQAGSQRPDFALFLGAIEAVEATVTSKTLVWGGQNITKSLYSLSKV